MTVLALTFAGPAAGPAVVTFAEGDPARPVLSGLAVPFGVPSGPAMDGNRYEFAGPPSNADELVDVVEGHDEDAVIGRLAEPWTVDEAGMSARSRLFGTTRARDVAELQSEGVANAYSVGASIESFAEGDDGIRRVAAGDWTARHLGVVRNPAFTQTRGLTVAASAHTGDTVPPETDPTTPPAGSVVDLGAASAVTLADLAAAVAEVLETTERTGAHPLARFASREHYLSEFAAAYLAGDVDTTRQLAVAFAAVDQITTNNPGVIPPNWRTRIITNLDARRPIITAAGGPIGLGDAGMDVNWPYFDGNLDAMITEQLAQKTELNSVRVDIKKGTAQIKSAGVYSDISYQLLMRSSPVYLAAYLSINEAAWARFTEAQFSVAVAAAGVESVGSVPALQAAGAITASTFRKQIFEASADVEDATGKPATYVAASSDVFVELGGLDTLVTPVYGTQNVAGTADAATLTINVANLPVVRGRFLPAGTVIVSNDEAAKFSESGPMTATAEDVAKLGHDVATWGMYVPAEVYYPTGVVRLDRAP